MLLLLLPDLDIIAVEAGSTTEKQSKSTFFFPLPIRLEQLAVDVGGNIDMHMGIDKRISKVLLQSGLPTRLYVQYVQGLIPSTHQDTLCPEVHTAS